MKLFPAARSTCVLIGSTLLALSVLPAAAQPPRSDGPRNRSDRQATPEQPAPSPEAMRLFISRQLDRMHRQQQTLEEAIRRLDRGDSSQSVREFLQQRFPGNGARRGADLDQPIEPAEALAVLAELNPRLHDRLSDLETSRPRRFEREMARLMPRLRNMVRLRAEDPDKWALRVEMFKTEQRCRRLADRAIGALDDDERERLLRELHEAVSQQFAVRERMHALELTRASRNLERERQKLEDARANRRQLIGERVEQLLDLAARNELLDDRPPDAEDRDI